MEEQNIAEWLNSLSPSDRKQYELLFKFVEELEQGKRDVPERCVGCPAHSFEFGTVITDICLLNTEVYSGDLFFGTKKRRPRWCPAKKYRNKAKEH